MWRPAKLQRVTAATLLPRGDFSMAHPYPFLFECVVNFLRLIDLGQLIHVSRQWHRLVQIHLSSLTELDLRCFRRLTPRVLVFLVGIAQQVTSLRKLRVLGVDLSEKYAGVFGLLLLGNPGISVIEFEGCLHAAVVREIEKYCPNLETLWKTDSQTQQQPKGTDGEDAEDTPVTQLGEEPMDGSVLAGILHGCPRLRRLRFGGVIWGVAGRPQTAPFSSESPPLVHEEIRVLHIENVGWGHTHGTTTARFPKCTFPRLLDLCVEERHDALASGGSLPLADIFNIIDHSPGLERLEISAQLTFTARDCDEIVRCVPKLRTLRLKPYTSAYSPNTPQRMSDEALDVLLRSLPLDSLSIENTTWDEHWTDYADLEEPFLLLQAPVPSLGTFVLNMPRFRLLRSCVLFGEVTNHFVSSLLRGCPQLRRLELYLMGRHMDVDDRLFDCADDDDTVMSEDGHSGGKPGQQLTSLHLHVRPRLPHGGPVAGSSTLLTYRCLTGLSRRFPALRKLALLGLPQTDSQVCLAIAEHARQVQHLVIGPVLVTTSELLHMVGRCLDLRTVELCWDKGSLPQSDGEFDIALGTTTLWQIIRRINPNLTVRDAGMGHFYDL